MNPRLAKIQKKSSRIPYFFPSFRIWKKIDFFFLLFSEPEINPRLAKMQKSAMYKNPLIFSNFFFKSD